MKKNINIVRKGQGVNATYKVSSCNPCLIKYEV